MSRYGYAGKILYVDLSDRDYWTEELSDRLIEKYIGGMGINVYLLYKNTRKGIDPFSPENVIVYGAGVLSGLLLPGCSRSDVATKSPLTGLITTSGSGFSTATMLKYAGYDHLVIKGKADKPIFLRIDNDSVFFEDASDLWGLDMVSASYKLHRKLGDEYWISVIGPAGERLVRFASVMENNFAMLGRLGIGAVFGSKNLKAVAVRGDKGVKIAHRGRFFKIVKELRKRVLNRPQTYLWRYGDVLEVYTDGFARAGLVSLNNYSIGDPNLASNNFKQSEYKARIWKRYQACIGCPVACRGVLRLRDNELGEIEFKIANPWGTPIYFAGAGVRSWDYGVKCSYLVNLYGIDAFTSTATAAFAIDLYKHGILTKDDTGGMELDWNGESVCHLIRMIGERKYIGDLLAEGIKRAAEKIGRGAEYYAVHIRGLDPQLELRGIKIGENFGQLTNPRGPHQARSLSITFAPRKYSSLVRYLKGIGVPEEAIKRIMKGQDGLGPAFYNVARFVKWVQDYNSLYFSLGFCDRTQVAHLYNLQFITELYEIVTGIKREPEEMREAGERIWTLQWLFNIREGVTRRDNLPPPKMLNEDLKVGEAIYPKLDLQKINKMLDDYYDERGWDIQRGWPTPEKLRLLGMDEDFKEIIELVS